MGNKTKKEEEYSSLKNFIKFCSDPITQELTEAEDISKEKQERPDIVLRKGDCIFGIEHISVPLLKIENGDAERIESAHKRRTFNRYRLDDGVDRLSGKEESALKEIEDIVNARKSSLSTFTHSDYIQNLAELLANHDAKIYRQNISSEYPNSKIQILFLLDIAYPDEFSKGLEYRKTDSSTWNIFIRNDYPFTYAFINTLSMKQYVDAFCIIWHPLSNYSSKKSEYYNLQPKTDIFKYINTMIWEEFRLPLKFRLPKKVKLDLKRKDNG